MASVDTDIRVGDLFIRPVTGTVMLVIDVACRPSYSRTSPLCVKYVWWSADSRVYCARANVIEKHQAAMNILDGHWQRLSCG